MPYIGPEEGTQTSHKGTLISFFKSHKIKKKCVKEAHPGTLKLALTGSYNNPVSVNFFQHA